MTAPRAGAQPARPTGLRRGSNLGRVADFNASVILDAIRRSPVGISRAELTAMTRLSPQTVSDICAQLIREGLIAETGTTTTGIGRPRRTLEFVAESRYALGIHIDPAAITFVLLDLRGNLLASHREDIRHVPEPTRLIADMASSLEQLVTTAGVDRSRIVGLGIAAPGPLDLDSGTIVDPPHLPGWHRVRLRDDLHAATSLPVVLAKDVTAAAVAERWVGSAVGAKNLAFLYLGTGIGVGFVNDDVVQVGASGNTGDIGHLIVDSRGTPCPCGQNGCLGVACSPLTLTREAVAAGAISPDGADDEIYAVARLAQVCRAADSGDSRAVEILHRAATRLARGILTITNLIDTDLVVCGGPAWAPAAHIYLPVLHEEIRLHAKVRAVQDLQLQIQGTVLGADVGAIGAGCLVLDDTFAARPNALLLN